MNEPTCEICHTPLEYSGRGRPPKRCAEHKGIKTEEVPKEQKVSEESKSPPSRPRPPAQRSAPPKAEGQVQETHSEETGSDSGLRKMPPVGKADTQSRAKAETAARRSNEQNGELEPVPMGVGGRPMAKIIFSASELIPTGQYANVSVGPAQIHAFVDLDRESEGDGYFSDSEKQTLVTALNELAEVVERDVVAVQRNLVLESIQEQLSTNGNS